MTRRTLSLYRRRSYQLARTLGDVESMRSPSAFSKRYVRRKVYKVANVNLGRSLRRMGL